MVKVKSSSPVGNSNSVNWILFSLVAVVLYFQTNGADPFNSPKSWILYLVAAWLVGHIVSTRIDHKEFKLLIFLVVGFISSAFIVTVFTDFKYVAIFGDTQRRNGFLSYFALGILFIASAFFIRFDNIRRFFQTVSAIAFVSITYGIMQTSGRDFVNWNNPHNSLIGTVGNPNFAAAVMAIMGTLLLSSLFFVEFSMLQKMISFFSALMLLVLIYRSGARQGLLAFAIGAIVFLTLWAFDKNKILGLGVLSISILIALFSVLGMLQIGPLERILYKPSVSVRGFYWRAGIEMFKDHPILGIGMDRYGAYFNQYRELDYPLRYGFELTSSNAHNTFIQFFATGGIFLGVSYLFLNLYVLKCAVNYFKSNKGPKKVIFTSIFSAWVAFHSQSLISIDNLGVSIWGWILGGIICGLSISSLNNTESIKPQSKKLINLKQATFSAVPTLMISTLVMFLLQGETRAYQAGAGFIPQDKQSVMLFQEIQSKVISTPLIDPNYRLRSAENLIQIGQSTEGLRVMKDIHESDPRNEMALLSLSIYYESVGDFSSAIMFREKIKNLNPWNAKNLLFLGKDYKSLGNTIKSSEILKLIASFSTGVNGGPILEQAQKELA
jgi:O-antigen ligase